MGEDEEQVEPSLHLLRECGKLFTQTGPRQEEERKERLGSFRNNCKLGLDIIMGEFIKHVNNRREKYSH